MNFIQEAQRLFHTSRVAMLHRKSFDFNTVRVINEARRMYLVRGKDDSGEIIAIIKGDSIDTFSLQEWDLIAQNASSMLSA